MDLLIVALVIALFLGLTLYGLSRKKSPAQLAHETFSPPPFAQHESYPWGEAWVYDNDRDRASPLTPVLFIHGLGGSSYSWRFQISALSSSSPVIAIDLLGFGKSSKPLDQAYDLEAHSQRILDILDAKGIDHCYLVGCSLGGALALWLSANHKQRFLRTVAISPAALFSVAPFPLPFYGSLGKIGQRIINRSIIKMALQNGTVHHHKIQPPVVDAYYEPFKEPGAMNSFFKTIATIKDIRIYRSLENISTPTLILYGHGDRVITKKVIEKIVSANSRFLWEQHPVGGHHLMEDEPEWVNSHLKKFLQL